MTRDLLIPVSETWEQPPLTIVARGDPDDLGRDGGAWHDGEAVYERLPSGTDVRVGTVPHDAREVTRGDV